MAEVRRAGDRLARRFNYDLRALFEYLQQRDRERVAAGPTGTDGKSGVKPKPRKPRTKAKKQTR